MRRRNMFQGSGSYTRLAGIFIAAVAASGLLYVAFLYGPQPDHQGQKQRSAIPDTTAALPLPPQSSARLNSVDVLMKLFGSAGILVDQGCDINPPAEFFRALETKHQRQGFQSVDGAARPSSSLFGRAQQIYWREQADGSEFLGAAVIQNSQLELKLTLGSPSSGCRTQWRTYRYAISNQPRLAPGNTLRNETRSSDFEDVPRPPGGHQLFRMVGPYGSDVQAFISSEPALELEQWYRQQMSPVWQSLEVAADLEFGHRAVMNFAHQDRYCVIWFSYNARGNTMILMSTGRNQFQKD